MAETIDVTPTGQRAPRTVPQSAINLAHVLYGLHALAPFTMLTLAVVAMIIGAVKRDEVRDTWMETHFSWLSRTFWWGLLCWVLALGAYFIISFVTLGVGALFAWIFPAAVFVWYLYRVFVGWLRLGNLQPIS
ncbi:MAG: hypothetical protein ABI583_05660 [Betaproteobacteria bacterium]